MITTTNLPELAPMNRGEGLADLHPVYAKGGRTGRKLHRGIAESSATDCGKWLRHQLTNYAVPAGKTAGWDLCERCFHSGAPEVEVAPEPEPEPEPTPEPAKRTGRTPAQKAYRAARQAEARAKAPAQVFYTRAQVAERIGVRDPKLKGYDLPAPDAQIGQVVGWLPATIAKWEHARQAAKAGK